MLRRKLLSFLNRTPLATQYFIFTFCLIFIVSFISLLTEIFDYQAYKKNRQEELSALTNQVASTIKSVFNTTYDMQVFMGKQIAKHNPNDLDFIFELFKNYSEVRNDTQNFYSWPLYDWTDKHKKLIVNTKTGLQSADFSRFNYLQQTKDFPWQLKISAPLLGYPSGEWVIVESTGITNNNNQYLGSIGVGINIRRLVQVLENITSSKQASFVVVDLKGRVVLSSSDNSSLAYNNIFCNPKQFNQHKQEGLISYTIESDNIRYLYYRKMIRYPYYILIGSNTKFLQQQFRSIILPKLIKSIGVSGTILILMLLFFKLFIQPVSKLSKQALSISQGNLDFEPVSSGIGEITNLSKGLLQLKRYLLRTRRNYDRLMKSNQELVLAYNDLNLKQNKLQENQYELEKAIQITQDSDDAKEKLTRQVHTDLQKSVNTILQNTKHLIKNLENSNKMNSLQTHLQGIITSALELKTFTRTTLQLNLTNIHDLIKESIRIHSKNIFNKNIILETNFDQAIPLIHTDAVSLTQVIASLLKRAIDNILKNGVIRIICEHLILKQHANRLHIVIEDTGFGLAEGDQQRIKKRFAVDEYTDGIELKLDAIQKIIERHQGRLHIHSEWNKGTRAIISLPCTQDQTVVARANNIYTLHKFKNSSPN